MGNSTSRPTNKLNMLVEETKDLSFSLSQNISQIAEQTVVSTQKQDVVINLEQLQGCKIDITQNMNIVANQTALFKAVFTNPRELINRLTKGPNSMLEKATSSTSPIMKDFINIAKTKLQAGTDADLKAKITMIFKVNIDQNSIQKCSQNIFTNQEQRVTILGKLCKDSNIKIAQDMAVVAAQDCFFEIVQNALMEDPTMRVAVRDFNGDYDKGLTDEQLDAGVNLTPACFNNGKTVYRSLPSSKDAPVAKLSNLPKITRIFGEQKDGKIYIYIAVVVILIIILILINFI